MDACFPLPRTLLGNTSKDSTPGHNHYVKLKNHQASIRQLKIPFPPTITQCPTRAPQNKNGDPEFLLSPRLNMVGALASGPVFQVHPGVLGRFPREGLHPFAIDVARLVQPADGIGERYAWVAKLKAEFFFHPRVVGYHPVGGVSNRFARDGMI